MNPGEAPIMRDERRRIGRKPWERDRTRGNRGQSVHDLAPPGILLKWQTCLRRHCIGIPIGLVLIFWGAGANSQELTHSLALQYLRKNFSQMEAPVNSAAAEASVVRSPANPGPILSLSFEGAGRTDIYGIEQEIAVNGQRRLLRRAGQSAAAADTADAIHELRQTESRMLEAFYQLIRAQKRKEIIQHAITVLEKIVSVVQELHVKGMASRLDGFLAEEAHAELGVAGAESDIAIVEMRALLAGLLGGRVDPEKLRASGTLDPRYELPPLGAALAESLSSRYDFQAATERLQLSRLEAEAANRWRLPNPKILGGIKRADLGDRYAVGPFFAVSIPLSVSGQRRQLKTSASAVESDRRIRLNRLRHRILSEVRAAHHTLRIRRQVVEDYRSRSLVSLDELNKIALTEYRAGKMDETNLLNAVRAALDAALRLLELQAASKLAEIEFDRVSGKDAL